MIQPRIRSGEPLRAHFAQFRPLIDPRKRPLHIFFAQMVHVTLGEVNRPISFNRAAKAVDKRLYFLSVGFSSGGGAPSRLQILAGQGRAGMSLPGLMKLMGHADIETSLRFVQVTPQDVCLQYARTVAQCIRPIPGNPS